MYSNEIRWLAMFKVFHLGYTFSDVVEDFKPWKIHEDTIQRWARRYEATGSVAPMQANGQPCKLSAEQELELVDQVLDSPTISMLDSTRNQATHMSKCIRHNHEHDQ